ncbi:monoacylglycerol lipase ABHD6b isoform X1 [Betta splendens]|uniref:Monoacylglycerol lipase ABHD6b isoform X1 n=1 Tax=Betta splendens TaxID=158456 RepID=A0A8M1HFZ2_BETSP|nr:monoacylglycerol lipase ABHD6b isoform X1 [Betta splendens]XP_040927387.1 monoacylglycerol lipase ABHD6b isoform X1 [Betta splendens]
MAADLDVLNLFIIAGGTLAIPILAFVASFIFWPSALIKVYYWYWRRTLGLQVRYADCGGYRFCYSCRGKPGMRPSILMLHGFSAHKDTWLTVVKYLPRHLHIVCVDMPGHEGTTRTSTEDYSIQGQVRRIHQVHGRGLCKPARYTLPLQSPCARSPQFVKSIGINRKPFHLVGTSMGGTVAGVYAACHPAEICSITLICPFGTTHPCETKFDNHLQDLEQSNFTLNIPLIPTTPDEMEDMFRLCSHVRFKIPQQILQGLVDVQQPHITFFQEVFMEIFGEKSRYALQEHLHLITAPLQVIWGKQDQVVDVSGAAVIAEALSGCRVDLLDNCGHSVVMERPCRTAKLILDFIIAQQNASGGAKKSS